MEIRTVVTTIVAVTLGVMLCGSLLIPIASDVMDDLADKGFDTWSSMVGVVVLVTLVSLVVLALYSYTEKK